MLTRQYSDGDVCLGSSTSIDLAGSPRVQRKSSIGRSAYRDPTRRSLSILPKTGTQVPGVVSLFAQAMTKHTPNSCDQNRLGNILFRDCGRSFRSNFWKVLKFLEYFAVISNFRVTKQETRTLSTLDTQRNSLRSLSPKTTETLYASGCNSAPTSFIQQHVAIQVSLHEKLQVNSRAYSSEIDEIEMFATTTVRNLDKFNMS